MRSSILFAAMAMLPTSLFAQSPQAGKQSPNIRKVTASSPQAVQYGKLELTVDLAATYENPFDPDQVRLDAAIK